ncbi:MAG: hypothetical protein RSB05_03255 [Clostridiales bacterium]
MSYLITNQNNFAGVPYPCPSYPKATVKSGGCGACAVLNCVENISSLRFDMGSWINYVVKNRGRIDGGTDIAAILRGLKRDYGFDYEGTNDLDKIKNHLKQGGMAVFHVGGAYGGWKGLLSSEGHYVCVAGVSDSDKAIVIDSGWYRGKYSGAWRKARVFQWEQSGVLSVSWENMEKDKKYRNNQGNNYYLVYAPKIGKETEDKEMMYKKIGDVPDWARPAVQLRVDLGAIKDPNNMSVYDSNLVDWVAFDRENPYYKDIADVPTHWLEDVKTLVKNDAIRGDGINQIAMRHSELKAIIVAKRICEK